MLFLLLSRLPIKLNQQMMLIIGFGIYLAICGLMYMKKIPTPVIAGYTIDAKYILALGAVDYVIYMVAEKYLVPSGPPRERRQESIGGRPQNVPRQQLPSSQEEEISEGIPNIPAHKMFHPPSPPDENLLKPHEDAQTEDAPKEASLPGNDYFKDEEESKVVVENWDMDDYTHEEFVNQSEMAKESA